MSEQSDARVSLTTTQQGLLRDDISFGSVFLEVKSLIAVTTLYSNYCFQPNLEVVGSTPGPGRSFYLFFIKYFWLAVGLRMLLSFSASNSSQKLFFKCHVLER